MNSIAGDVNRIFRLQGLDALRGLAALAVVLFHYTAGFNEVMHRHHDHVWINFPFPAIGVQVFFAISGFVIFMTLERCPSPRDFFVSRFARIYPAFFACLLITACVRFATDVYPGRFGFLDVILNFPLVVGVLGKTYVDPSYWTLTLEMSFYASLAFTYYVIQQNTNAGTNNFWRLQKNPMAWALIFWLLVGLTGRSVDGADLYSRISLALNLQYSHLFVAGIAVYGLSQRHVLMPSILLIMAAIMGGASGWGHFSLGGSFKIILFAGLVLGAASLNLKGWVARLASFLGGISYSLYLIHQVMGYVLIDELEAMGVNSNMAILLAAGVAILSAHLIRNHVEIPAQSLIRQKYAEWKSSPRAKNKKPPAGIEPTSGL